LPYGRICKERAEVLTINLELRVQTDGLKLDVPVRRVVNGGYTGRDRAHVQAHIDEMKVLDLPTPKTTPTIYFLSSDRVSTAKTIEVQSGSTSGEVEPVLVWHEGQIYVTVGSDHTDRHLESFDIPASKQCYPNLLAEEVWPLEEVRERWDSLTITCHVEKDGQRSLYQRGSLEDMLPFSYWVDRLQNEYPPLADTVFFAGTVPTADGGLVYADTYEVALEDPIRGRVITHVYRVNRLPEPVQ
jgi:Protein of unknown function (DUF2848)